MSKLKLLSTGFMQVFFVCVNTYFIGKELYTGVFIVGCIISLIWSYNVKKISIGSNMDRIVYSLGAGLGAVSGLKASVYLINYL
jgi:hypothetical protein